MTFSRTPKERQICFSGKMPFRKASVVAFFRKLWRYHCSGSLVTRWFFHMHLAEERARISARAHALKPLACKKQMVARPSEAQVGEKIYEGKIDVS